MSSEAFHHHLVLVGRLVEVHEMAASVVSKQIGDMKMKIRICLLLQEWMLAPSRSPKPDGNLAALLDHLWLDLHLVEMASCLLMWCSVR